MEWALKKVIIKVLHCLKDSVYTVGKNILRFCYMVGTSDAVETVPMKLRQ
jgi:hypothetical protein